ncbi:hypothetical protein ACWD4T_52060, partial [Streptomyces umbrinus]
MTPVRTAAVEEALRRLETTEPELRAWVRVDADGARAQAERAPAGPLSGVPFGADVRGQAAGDLVYPELEPRGV